MTMISGNYVRLTVRNGALHYQDPTTQEWVENSHFRCGPNGHEVWVKFADDKQSVIVESKQNGLKRVIRPFAGQIWACVHFSLKTFWPRKLVELFAPSRVQHIFFSTRPSS